jgi:hypothetical protein
LLSSQNGQTLIKRLKNRVDAEKEPLKLSEIDAIFRKIASKEPNQNLINRK